MVPGVVCSTLWTISRAFGKLFESCLLAQCHNTHNSHKAVLYYNALAEVLVSENIPRLSTSTFPLVSVRKTSRGTRGTSAK